MVESVWIERLSGVPDECLNNKSEWVGSKITGIRVNNSKVLIVRDACQGKEG